MSLVATVNDVRYLTLPKEGLQAMLSGAILYGGLVYVLGGGLGKREQLHFKELPVEF